MLKRISLKQIVLMENGTGQVLFSFAQGFALKYPIE
jgi:hypothetical protein